MMNIFDYKKKLSSKKNKSNNKRASSDTASASNSLKSSKGDGGTYTKILRPELPPITRNKTNKINKTNNDDKLRAALFKKDGVHADNNPKEIKKRRKKKKRARPFTVVLTFLLMILIMVSFAVGGALIGAYIGVIKSIPDLGIMGIKPGIYTSFIYDRDGNQTARLHGEENREYATIDQIPKYMQDAVVAIEDERFYEHNGVDIQGLARAAYSTISGGQLQGGSTLTQQLIKNNITKVTRNTPKTKIKEQYLAIKYEKELTEQFENSKEQAKSYILELYLNTIGLGHGYNGVKTAAEGYFGKDLSDLTLAECASLAGITNNPTIYSPRTQPENNRSRQVIILNYMLEQGRITQEEYDKAINEDVYAKVKNSSTSSGNNEDVSSIHSYYDDALIDQVSEDLQYKYNWSVQEANNIIYNGGLQIYSNMDPDIQNIVDLEFEKDSNFPNVTYAIGIDYRVSIEDSTTGEQTHSQYKQFARSQSSAEGWVESKKQSIEEGLSPNQKIALDKVYYTKQPQSAMAIIDYRTGQVMAISGGRGEKTVNRGFNRATDAARQPGSVFKVLAAFVPAFDLGKMSNASTIIDEPYSTADGYSPKNWNNSYIGAVPPRTAIKNSMNIATVKTMVTTGIDLCYDYLLNFGFTTLENDNHASTALGGLTHGVTQVEVAAAYGTIANNGQYLRPYFYSKVLDHDGNVILENSQEPVQVIKSSTSYIITDLMKSVVTGGTGTAANLGSMPVSGKTGTTTETKDLTFVGYTPYYVCSVWLGYDYYDDLVKNMTLRNQSIHLTLWKNVMSKIHQNLEVKDFEIPDTVVQAKVCKISGKKANSRIGCPSVTDYFDKESVSQYCTGHKGYSQRYFTSGVTTPSKAANNEELPLNNTHNIGNNAVDSSDDDSDQLVENNRIDRNDIDIDTQQTSPSDLDSDGESSDEVELFD